MTDHDILDDEVHYEDFNIIDTIDEILDIAPESKDADILETKAFLYLAGELDEEPSDEVKKFAHDILTGEWLKSKEAHHANQLENTF